jgi:hypothetical protein
MTAVRTRVRMPKCSPVELALRRNLLIRVRDIIRRCGDPRCKNFPTYGGRGIKVHPGWVADKLAFVEYLMTLPGHDDRSLFIDRIDNDGHYEPGNLRFVTPAVSRLNTRHAQSPHGHRLRTQGATMVRSGRWQGQIYIGNRNHYVGVFDTKEECLAAVARFAAERGIVKL